MELFTIFTSSAIIDHVILNDFPQNDWVWLAIASEVQKQHLTQRNGNKILFMHKNVFTLPVSFTGSYTEDKPNLPRQNHLILQKKGVWRAQGCEFQGLFKTL